MRRLQFLAAVFLLASAPMAAAAAQPQLRPDYYAGVCPNLESIVRGAVQQSVALSPLAAPATLRLFFHDCAVRVRAIILLLTPIRGLMPCRHSCDL
jgi:peroxidase